MLVIFLGILCLGFVGLSKGHFTRTDLIVESSRNYYLIQKDELRYRSVDALRPCVEKYEYKYLCYEKGSLRWLQPYEYFDYIFFVKEIRPTEVLCPYLWTTPRQDGIVSLQGYCLKYCLLCYCYFSREQLAVVQESDLEGGIDKDEGGSRFNETVDTTTQEGTTSADDNFGPEPTTLKPKDEPEYFEQPGNGRGQSKEKEKLIANQSRSFAINLLKAMRDEYEGENLMSSPSAILAILKIFLSGAQGYTKRRLENVIGEPQDIQTIMITGQRRPTLEMKTALMYTTQYAMRRSKQRYLNEQGVDTIRISFNRPRQAARQINAWLSMGLDKEIDIFQPDDLEFTDLVVLNTLSFSGKFEKPFVSETIEEFQTLDGSTYNISMMSSKPGEAIQTVKSQQLNADIVDLPYKESKLKMRLIIPNDGVTLRQVEDKLSAEELQDIDRTIQERNITLKMPKVLYDMKKPMEGTLKRMGLKDLLQGANLKSLFRSQPSVYYSFHNPDFELIRIGNFFHSVGINITEEGTSVSSTSFAVPVRNLLRDDEIIANKPFLLFIEDSISHQILFFGRIGH